jgi:hypothetical protein
MFAGQDQDRPIADVIEQLKECAMLILQNEVTKLGFWTTTVLTAELDLSNASRHRVENRLSVADLEPFKAAEVENLKQFE